MAMRKEYATIGELIRDNLHVEEDNETLKLIGGLEGVRERGYFIKEEFLKMAMWKSARPRHQYLKNSEEEIVSVSRKLFSAESERKKIGLLTSLKGVSIPTASAILTLTDPQNYGVIDIRVWQMLYLYGSVKAKPSGRNFGFNDWSDYLAKLRYYAAKFRAPVRDIERAIFWYHRKMQQGKLYR